MIDDGIIVIYQCRLPQRHRGCETIAVATVHIFQRFVPGVLLSTYEARSAALLCIHACPATLLTIRQKRRGFGWSPLEDELRNPAICFPGTRSCHFWWLGRFQGTPTRLLVRVWGVGVMATLGGRSKFNPGRNPSSCQEPAFVRFSRLPQKGANNGGFPWIYYAVTLCIWRLLL
jgi:hypothetical protein